MEKIKYAFFFIFIGKAATVSAMLLAPSTSAQMPVQNDTFEKSARTEYVTNPVDTLGDGVYDLSANPVGNKERGEYFNRWFWAMFACVDENGEFQDSRLGNAPKYIKVPNKDYRQLAADIICTFDKDGDNKVNYQEYADKSQELLCQRVGKKLPPDVLHQYREEMFYPLFYGLDYDRNTKEYNIDEVAATIYALDLASSGGKGILNGEKMMKQVDYVIENDKPDKCFQSSRTSYYIDNNIKR